MVALDCFEQWCRVYSRTCLQADRDFMHQMESEAAAAAARVIALSRSDADFITQHLLPKNSAVPVTVSIWNYTEQLAFLCSARRVAGTLDHLPNQIV